MQKTFHDIKTHFQQRRLAGDNTEWAEQILSLMIEWYDFSSQFPWNPKMFTATSNGGACFHSMQLIKGKSLKTIIWVQWGDISAVFNTDGQTNRQMVFPYSSLVSKKYKFYSLRPSHAYIAFGKGKLERKTAREGGDKPILTKMIIFGIG